MAWVRSTTLTPLPREEFERRHRGLLWLLAAHLVVLPLFGMLEAWGPQAGLLLDVPIAVFGAAAAAPRLHRTARASACVMGLLCCSAAVVWLWHGTIEAHFHYFVIVGAVALYEAWLPYAIAIVFVILQHGAMSAWVPSHVFNHMAAMMHPWGWAAIHGAFIGALAAANLVSWRVNDALRTSEQQATEAALRSTERFKRAFAAAPNGAALISAEGTLLEVNAALAESVQTSSDALRGQPWFDLLPEAERDSARADWPPSDDAEETEHGLLRTDGSHGWLLWKHSPLPGDVLQWISQTTDISRRKRAEAELQHQAAHDALTGLPNRAAFQDLVQQVLDRRQPGEEVAVMFADLDDFKVVNDSLGHAAGDELLTAVTERLRSALRAGDVIGRFGGDEFVICLPGTDATAAYGAAARLAAALSVPFILARVERPVTASFGLVVTSDPEATVDSLLRDADIAMYEAKNDGKDRCRMFAESMRAGALERLELESELRDAVAQGTIFAHFQPQFSILDGRVTGFEALARWHSPTRGNVPPGVFIPIAEQSGLVGDISAHVLRIACRTAVEWAAAHPALAHLQVSANASPRCLCNPELIGVVRDILVDTGIEPGRVCLEITESAVIDRGDRTGEIIASLRALGIRLSIDDFGVGESSLSQLARLGALDELKIDKSFIDELAVPGSINAELVRAITRVAAKGGMTVVAEGIEHAEQLEALRALGCPIGQGYLLSRPKLPAEVLEELIGAARIV